MMRVFFCLGPTEIAVQLASMHNSVSSLMDVAIAGASTGVEAGYLTAIMTLTCN